jgi:hypothetical protein
MLCVERNHLFSERGKQALLFKFRPLDLNVGWKTYIFIALECVKESGNRSDPSIQKQEPVFMVRITADSDPCYVYQSSFFFFLGCILCVVVAPILDFATNWLLD